MASYRFMPVANYDGLVPDIIYVVSDGKGGFDTGKLTIQINSVNDDPVASNDTSQVNEDSLLSVSASTGLLSNDSDVD